MDPASEPAFGAEAHLHVTALSLNDHATHAKGRLEVFLSRTRPGRAYSVSTLYRTLFDEVRRRSSYEWDATSLDAILKNKALSRTEFQSLLDSVPEAKTFDSFWIQASAQLRSEGMTFSDIVPLRKACQSHEIARMDAGNAMLNELIAAAGIESAIANADTTMPTLRAKVDSAGAKVALRNLSGARVFDLTIIKAMVLMAIYEY